MAILAVVLAGGVITLASHPALDRMPGHAEDAHTAKTMRQKSGAPPPAEADLQKEYADKDLADLAFLYSELKLWQQPSESIANSDKVIAANRAEEQTLRAELARLGPERDRLWNRVRPSTRPGCLKSAPRMRLGPFWRTVSDDLGDQMASAQRRLDALQQADLAEEQLRVETIGAHLDALLSPYDGQSNAPGTYNEDDSSSTRPVNPPVRRPSGVYDPKLYDAVLNQFGVETNPRYEGRDDNTYCNIFIWDVTRAMGAEIPHWVDAAGSPISDIESYQDDGNSEGTELNANAVCAWLAEQGGEAGWRIASAEQAQQAANQGHPAVAAWPNPGQTGHVAMVRPGEYSATDGPLLAQSGSTNANALRASEAFRDGFGSQENPVVYYVHD
jgi:hypothetical protein